VAGAPPAASTSEGARARGRHPGPFPRADGEAGERGGMGRGARPTTSIPRWLSAGESLIAGRCNMGILPPASIPSKSFTATENGMQFRHLNSNVPLHPFVGIYAYNYFVCFMKTPMILHSISFLVLMFSKNTNSYLFSTINCKSKVFHEVLQV
jgi:hypothetical protein